MPISCLYLVFLIGLTSNIPAVMSSLTVSRNRSTVVLIGESVVMNCSVTGSETTAWTYTAWNTSTKSDIYLGFDIFPALRSRYKIDKNYNSGQHNLIVESVDFAHAGRYQCTTNFRKTLWRDIKLTVLGYVPVCGANTTEADVDGNQQSHVTIWCRINYTGHAYPVFTWTKDNAETNIAANTTASNTNGGLLTSTSSIMMQMHSNDSGVTYQCRITFPMPGHSENDYVYTWNYTWDYTWNYTWNYTVSMSSDAYTLDEATIRNTFLTPTSDGTLYSPESIGSNCGQFQTNVIIVISIIALILLILCLTMAVIIYKTRKTVNRESSQEQDYEMVDESNMKSGDFRELSQSRPRVERVERHSDENVDCEEYSSLQLGSSAACAQPAVYAQLEQYANSKGN